MNKVIELLADGPLTIQALVAKSGASYNSVTAVLRALVDRNLVVKTRFHDPAWPFHANIGRWLYSLPPTKTP